VAHLREVFGLLADAGYMQMSRGDAVHMHMGLEKLAGLLAEVGQERMSRAVPYWSPSGGEHQGCHLQNNWSLFAIKK
jgi:hypothetical protein